MIRSYSVFVLTLALVGGVAAESERLVFAVPRPVGSVEVSRYRAPVGFDLSAAGGVFVYDSQAQRRQDASAWLRYDGDALEPWTGSDERGVVHLYHQPPALSQAGYSFAHRSQAIDRDTRAAANFAGVLYARGFSDPRAVLLDLGERGAEPGAAILCGTLDGPAGLELVLAKSRRVKTFEGFETHQDLYRYPVEGSRSSFITSLPHGQIRDNFANSHGLVLYQDGRSYETKLLRIGEEPIDITERMRTYAPNAWRVVDAATLIVVEPPSTVQTPMGMVHADDGSIIRGAGSHAVLTYRTLAYPSLEEEVVRTVALPERVNPGPARVVAGNLIVTGPTMAAAIDIESGQLVGLIQGEGKGQSFDVASFGGELCLVRWGPEQAANARSVDRMARTPIGTPIVVESR